MLEVQQVPAWAEDRDGHVEVEDANLTFSAEHTVHDRAGQECWHQDESRCQERILQTCSTLCWGSNQVYCPYPEAGVQVEGDDAADVDEVEDWQEDAESLEKNDDGQDSQLDEDNKPP